MVSSRRRPVPDAAPTTVVLNTAGVTVIAIEDGVMPRNEVAAGATKTSPTDELRPGTPEERRRPGGEETRVTGRRKLLVEDDT